jgi:hypothetical protein
MSKSFFQEAMRIVAPDYLPNEMDVLRARTKTTGIYETRFQMGQLSIQYVFSSDKPPKVCITNRDFF